VFLGDPNYFDRDLNRYRAVTPSRLQQSARDWLCGGGRVLLSVVPRGRLALALADSETVAVS
jgi:hypothetical protein